MTHETVNDGAKAVSLGRAFRDLRPRIISGVTMLVATLTLLYAGTVPFAVQVLILSLIMSWEWGRVVRGDGMDVSLAVQCAVIVLAVTFAVLGWFWLAVFSVFAGGAAMLPLSDGRDGGLSAFGMHYVGIPAVVMIWMRADEPYGAAAVLFIFMMVWAADIAAFVGGRLIGGYKLWPSVSPNKTWAGLVSGVFASLVAAVAFGVVLNGTSLIYLVYIGMIGLIMGLISQGGDLAESALKRGHGVKDASDLIPGHGGVMDRMDGVVTVATAAGLLALIIDGDAPASALLFGPAWVGGP